MRDTAPLRARAPARFAALGAVACALLACGEQVLVAHIASEQRAQSDSLQRGSADADDARGAPDAGASPARADTSRDAAVDSGAKNDGKHDDDSDDHDKDKDKDHD